MLITDFDKKELQMDIEQIIEKYRQFLREKKQPPLNEEKERELREAYQRIMATKPAQQ